VLEFRREAGTPQPAGQPDDAFADALASAFSGRTGDAGDDSLRSGGGADHLKGNAG
jgi:hypothetical protein